MDAVQRLVTVMTPCLRRWLLLGLLLAVAGCATPPPTPPPAVIDWPAAPARMRVRRVGAIHTPADIGVRRSLLGRLVDRIAGRRSTPMLVRPMGIEVDGQGRLLVTDPGKQEVVILDREARRIGRIPADAKIHLPSPMDVAVALDGGFLVSDSALGRVLHFDRRGRYLDDLGSPGLLGRPTGIAVDSQRGRVYVADTTGHQIFVFNATGKVERVLGRRGAAPGELNFPTHLCLDGEGNLYVTDAMNFRIQIFDPQGKVVAALGHLGDGPGSFSKPKGVAVDSEGHIYVVDALFDNVQILDRQGRPLLAFAHSGTGPAGLWLPTGIAIDGDDRVFVADTYNHRIQIFQFHPGQDEP